MIVIYDKNKQRLPIKAWVDDVAVIDSISLRQAINLSNLPFAIKHIALMPDVHAGYGMPIGGVIALGGHVIPNAVGVDIGCGISFVKTNLTADEISYEKYKLLSENILSKIPMGFENRKIALSFKILDKYKAHAYYPDKKLKEEIKKAYYQLGTLGGGNHFIELQKNSEGKLCIMVHSGSRHFGHTIASSFHRLASKRMGKTIDKELAYLDVDSFEGKAYIEWMNMALAFAKENRRVIIDEVLNTIEVKLEKFQIEQRIDVHHNYAAFEEVDGKKYWIHRKGAISAKKGEIGIIPSTMGGESYLVEGKGNSESFQSSSHGAGRTISRNAAKKQFKNEETISMMNKHKIILGIKKGSIISDEDPRAYKEINWVLEQEKDLIEIVDKVKTIVVIKG
ncbi:MAG: RtcB family protein [Bacillota bacterium]|nr:RtcB family protein [Bacillota bacterium]